MNTTPGAAVAAEPVPTDCEILRIEGPLTFASLPRVLEQTREFESRLDLPARLEIDLAAVVDVDSSAVALLLRWEREAARLKKQLRFVNLPANLAALAELYGVKQFIKQ